MIDPSRKERLIDIIHDIYQPPSPGQKKLDTTKRKQYRKAFLSGELAVLEQVTLTSPTSLADVKSIIATKALLALDLISISKGSNTVRLTRQGISVSKFLFPHLHQNVSKAQLH